jgi:hypothetical protein
MRLNSLINETFGRWTVIERAENTAQGQTRWLCRCECGNQKVVTRTVLTSGKSSSCGCLKRETTIARNTKHGHATEGISPTYHTWSGMTNRCNNPSHRSYKDYGGKGIRVCENWATFEGFLADMGEKPEGMSLEREKNEKSYCKENCVWANAKTQARNKTTTKLLSYQGQTKSVAEWAQLLQVPYSTISYRVQQGWSDEDALGTPFGTKFVNARSRMLTYNGKTQTIPQWARELRIPAARIHKRIQRGTSAEDALSSHRPDS